ncbi:BamA/TamA family outer membrane protein [Hymenobacter weizhouensis]|uniref:BamA/TamA family outer membrane protein n=1 Tax=Hymenobacter sp. YIM 151500-1 TaxID=2987689 RepID=UPI002226F122|nr:BamA/TamA family outer membrane protein [Hymenobacter sp. YIM 151500-1]UYZ61700.1 BamA/TamA family outer membrane protein [Hymenobacter sp. YIM 151500-1]
MRFLCSVLALCLLPLFGSAQVTPIDSAAGSTAPPPPTSRTGIRGWFEPRDKPNLIPLPFVFAQQETGFAGGLSILPVWRFGKDTTVRKSNARLFAWVSQEGQSTAQLTHTIFTKGEKLLFSGELSHYNQELFFYGIGNETSRSRESTLSYKLLIFDQKALARVRPNLFAGVRYRLTNTTDIEPVGTDNEGRLHSFLSDPRVSARERQNTFVSGFGPAVLYDSRDNVLATYRGWFVDAYGTVNRRWTGSDFHFTRYQLDVRHFRPLFGSTNTILALNFIGQFHGGNVPFRELGGMAENLSSALFNYASIMRGIYELRFRDRQTVAFQGEIRQKLFWRIDGAVFAGVGEVGNRVSDLELDKTKIAGGAGLRFRFNRRDRLNIRLDYAGGSNSPGTFFLALGEAF